MLPILVSSIHLEDTIEAVLTDRLGVCFENVPSSLVGLMVDHYNRCETEALLEAVIESTHYQVDDYSPAELFISLFTRLIESNTDTVQFKVTLEWWPDENTLVVRSSRRTPPNPTLKLMEDYRHATEQGDYYPERLRRAFDELMSNGI